MKITLNGADYNRIMRVCGPAISQEKRDEALQYIEIQCNGQGEGCATACDRCILSQTRFSCHGDKGVYLIRPTKTVRNDCIIEIAKENGKISISNGEETVTRAECASSYFCHADICKKAQKGKPKVTIAFSVRLMKQMLKSYDTGRQIVYLEMRGPENPVIVKSSDGGCGLALPVRINKEYEEPEFWRMEADDTKEVDAK